MRTKFEIAITAAKLAAVDQVVTRHVNAADRWWRAERELVASIRRPADRRRALAELYRRRDARRKAGEHFDTASAVLVHYLSRELDVRGWTQREWDPIPDDAGSMPGRPIGVAPNSRGKLDERLRVLVPAELAELLRRATWHTSAPIRERLYELSAVRTLSNEQRAERARLRADMETTGDVIRAAVERLTQS